MFLIVQNRHGELLHAALGLLTLVALIAVVVGVALAAAGAPALGVGSGAVGTSVLLARAGVFLLARWRARGVADHARRG